MSENQETSGQVGRGAAEELSGTPLTETEEQVSRPPQERDADDPQETPPTS